jgi:hypothetical protein
MLFLKPKNITTVKTVQHVVFSHILKKSCDQLQNEKVMGWINRLQSPRIVAAHHSLCKTPYITTPPLKSDFFLWKEQTFLSVHRDGL